MSPLLHKMRRLALIILLLLVLPLALAGCMMAQPVFGSGKRSAATVDPDALRRHVESICSNCTPRSYVDTRNLARCAGWIGAAFSNVGGRVTNQVYVADGREYSNVIGRFGPEQGPVVVVGAHYDACSGMPAADDNASGVAGLVELAVLFGREAPPCTVELVAYCTEEPPFFATPDMGSVNHAKALKSSGADVRGVIVLEMIGFFSDEAGSQLYPSSLLRLFYPATGDFISVVGNLGQTRLVRQVKRAMRGATDLPVRSINAPTFIAGVDFSDHRSYWDAGFQAVMVTDTSFYRNRAYHTWGDTPDRLDYRRMAKVVIGVYEAVRALGQ